MMAAQQKKGLLNCWLKPRSIRAFYFVRILSINKKNKNKINLMRIKKKYQIEGKKILIKIMILMI
jgi:hypothetical protein